MDPRVSALTPGARWALAALAGVLNGVAFIFWGPLALVANVPLLIALHGARRRWLTAGLGGLVGFMGGLHIYGILDYGQLLFWGFAGYTGSQMVAYALLHRWLWGKLHPAVDLALPALIWTLTEWMRTLGPLAMPASYVGCIADVPALRPWLALAPFTGGLGVSTLVALSQSVLAHALVGSARHRRWAAVGAGLLLGAYGLGLACPPPLGDEPIAVVGVQGGLANGQYAAAYADPLAAADIVRTYDTLSQRAYALRPDLVVWPETAVRTPLLDHPQTAAGFPRASDRSVLLAGLLHQADGRAYNRAVAIAPGGRVLGHYDKVRTVPKTEDYLTRGAAWTPIDTPVGRLGPIICLESVYPDASRAMVSAGAEVLLILSNDAGFGRSPITRHMTNRAIVRAVETGRWLLRVGQAGITTLIDPQGVPHGQLGLFEPAILSGEARLRRDQTLWVRWGSWWMGLCGLALVAIAAFTLRTGRQRGRAASA